MHLAEQDKHVTQSDTLSGVHLLKPCDVTTLRFRFALSGNFEFYKKGGQEKSSA